MAVPALVAGVGLQAFGQYRAGQEADVTSKYNQQVKEREAQAAEQQSMVASRKQAQAAARKMSTLRAQMGVAGAVSDTGAPMEILSEQARQSATENIEIGISGTQEAAKLRSQGQAIRRQGKAAKRAGRLGAGASLLTGFGTLGMS